MDVSGINIENPGFWVCVALGISVAIWSAVKHAADYWHSAARGALAVQQGQNAEMQVRLIIAETQRCAAKDALAVARQRDAVMHARRLETNRKIASINKNYSHMHKEYLAWRRAVGLPMNQEPEGLEAPLVDGLVKTTNLMMELEAAEDGRE